MSLKRPAAGGESCKQDPFLCKNGNDFHIDFKKEPAII